MSDEYQLRKDIDRFKKFLDQLEAVLYTKLNIDDLDVNNWLDEYYTSVEIDTLLSNLLMNIDEKVDVETITERLASKADKTELSSAIANINYLLTGKANTEHYHRWRGIIINENLNLYVNDALGVCELKFAKQFSSATADTYYTWFSNIIPAQYRPIGNAFGGLNYGGIIRVQGDGTVGGYFTRSISSTFTCLGSVMWHIGVGVIESEWYNHNSLTVNEIGTQTQLSNLGSSWGGYFANKSGTSASSLSDLIDWDSPFRVEFDVVNYSGDVYFQIYDGTNAHTQQKHLETDLGISNGSHISIVSDGEVVVYDVDGTLTTVEVALNTARVGFRVNSGALLTFKNFNIIPPSEDWTPPKTTPTISLTGSDVSVGSDVSLTGTLSAGSGKSVKIYQGETLIDTVTTTTDGVYNKTVSGLSVGSYTFHSVFDGDDNYNSVTSDNLTVSVGKLTPTISMSADNTTTTYGSDITLTGSLSVGNGASVKIYDGDTLIDTVTTSSTSFNKTISNASVGSHTYKAVFEGNSSYNSVTSSNVIVTVNKISTTVDISSSSSTATYNGSITLNGSLTNIPDGSSIKIYDGTTLVATVSSSSSSYTKTITGLSVGTHTYHAEYEGDTTHTNASSSDLTVTVSKATPTIGLTATNTSINVGDTLVLNGTLSITSSVSVKIYQGSTLLDTVTSSSGSFSKSVTGLSSGSYTFKATYEGNANYNSVTSSNVNVTVSASPTPTVDNITLSASNPILSYYHSESTSLSATVLDSSSNPVSGETVTFKQGSTTLGTGTTNSSGVATCSNSYSSTGVGDVTFTAQASSITSNTVTVEDCIFFDATETSKTTSSSMIKGNVYSNVSIPTLPNHFVWEMDMKVSSNSSSEDRFFLTPTAHSGEQPPYALWTQIASGGASKGGSRRNTSSIASSSSVTLSANTYGHFKVERNGDTITYYVNNTNVGSLTETWIDNYNSWWFSYSFWKRSNITGTWKNLKIKAL